jgi:uncharacterized repeat protein (TIGR01451 family)
VAEIHHLTVTHPTVPEVYATVYDTTTVKASAGRRYVATTGRVDPANSCLFTYYPCRTVAQAVDQAQDGEAVLVATGTYTDAQTAALGAVVPLLENKAIMIRGGYDVHKWHAPPSTDPRRTVLNAEGKGQVVDVRGAGQLTLNGLTLKRGREANVYGRTARLVLTNCNILSAAPGYGLYLYRSDNASLDRARVFDNADHGLYLFVSQNMTLTNSIIGENAGHGMVLEGLDGTTNYANANLFYNTIVSNTGGYGIELYISRVEMRNTLVASQTVGVTGTVPTGVTQVAGSVHILDADYTLWHAVESEVGGKTTKMAWDIGRDNLYDDPLFAPPLDILRAYHLITGSAAIDQATDVGIATDVDGETRTLGETDIGADEMLPSLELSKRASTLLPKVGERLTYTIYLTNTGGVALTADVVDTLPSSVTLLVPSTARWMDQEIAPYTVWMADVIVETDLGYAGDLMNKVRVTTDEGALDETTLLTVTAIADAAMTLTPDRTRDADPGPVVYTHTLTNQGPIQDVFSLTHRTSQGWDVTYRPNPVALGYRGQPDASATVRITVTVPAGTLSDTLDVTVLTATSDVDPDVSVSVTDTTLVRLAPGLALKPNRTQAADPEMDIVYTFTLTNTGNGLDTFDLTAVSAHGWSVVVNPLQTQALAFDEAELVSVTLTIPIGTGGLQDTLMLTATSRSAPDVVVTALATTTVNHDPAVSLTPDRAAIARSGSDVVYTHTLTNMGNGPDVFEIVHHSSQDWPVTYATPIAVGYGQSATMQVTVTVPTGNAGAMDTTIITATSQADASISASVTDTTTAERMAFTLSPSELVVPLTVGDQRTERLTVMNMSNVALHWRLVVRTPDWLSVTPTSGTVPLADQGTIDIGFNAAGLTNKLYVTELRIQSEDDTSVSQRLPVTMTVCYPVSATNMHYVPSSPKTGETVYFTGTAQGSAPITHTWDFDDESSQLITTTTAVQHMYDTAGLYSVILTVSNLCNGQLYTDTVTDTVEVVSAVLPDIEAPSTLQVELMTGQSTQTSLQIQNTGDTALVVTDVQEHPPVDWLTVTSTWPLTVTAGLSESVTLHFDASTLSAHTEQTTTLAINSNDPDEGIKDVAVTLRVTEARVYLPLVLRQ